MRKYIPLKLCLILCSLFVFSCASFDVSSRVNASGRIQNKQKAQGDSSAFVFIPIENPTPEIVEKPVFVPATEEAPKKTQEGQAAVAESNKTGIVKPSDYSHAAMVYDYNPLWVYEVYTQPLRVSDIYLKAGEKAVEPPFISDSERWMLGASISYENGEAIQHIYVKPVSAGLEASLIINTTERVYHIILRSFKDIHMPKVIWRYAENAMPKFYIAENGQSAETIAEILVDPRSLNLNYKITYSLFKKPKWLPKLVYDDAKKTYITFPQNMLQDVMPAVFENRNDIVNYRVVRNVIIIDKLVDTLTIKIEKQQVLIKKK